MQSAKTQGADFLVLGSGIAGVRAAIELARSGRVLVLSKGEIVFTGPTAEFHRHEQQLKGRYLSV